MIKAIANHNSFFHHWKENLEVVVVSSGRRNMRICKYFVYYTASLFLFLVTSCKKFVEVPPPSGTITENTVYSTDATAISVLTGIYSSMNAAPFQGSALEGSISLLAGLAADEYTLAAPGTSSVYFAYYQNALVQDGSQSYGGEHWALLYNLIFKCNAAIDGLSLSSGLTPAVKLQLLGEAKFMRAFFYFYLVNEFGDVPLLLNTDPELNVNASRLSISEVYKQVITDLLEARESLSADYLNATLLGTTSERIRPTKWVASALLSRVYLYTGDYAHAEEESSKVIGNTSLYGPISSVPMNNVFLKNSREAIWQIQPTALNYNTPEARTLIIPQTGPSTSSTTNPVYLSKQLLSGFEVNDQRVVLGNWINRTIYNRTSTVKDTVYFPFKYKLNNLDATINTTSGTANMKEYFMVLRLGEQYLIRSEARTMLGDIGGAQSDLNAIRNRAGLGNYLGATDQASLITAILNERRHELFSEWGHRWFDLRRSKTIDAVMNITTPLKANGASWQSYQAFCPIPFSELQKAPHLIQNSGY